jgi:hypothetical protein
LELARAKAAGSGGIDFASTSGEIEYAAKVSVDIANTISGFRGKDKIEFAKVKYAAGDHAVDASGEVKIETSAGNTIGTFDVAGTYVSANFKVGKDAAGDVLVTYATATAADMLGGYATAFAEPSWTRAGDLSAFDSWSALASGAGTDSGGFGFHGANVGAGATPWASALARTARPVTDLARSGGRLALRGVTSGQSRGAITARLIPLRARNVRFPLTPAARPCRSRSRRGRA